MHTWVRHSNNNNKTRRKTHIMYMKCADNVKWAVTKTSGAIWREKIKRIMSLYRHQILYRSLQCKILQDTSFPVLTKLFCFFCGIQHSPQLPLQLLAVAIALFMACFHFSIINPPSWQYNIIQMSKSRCFTQFLSLFSESQLDKSSTQIPDMLFYLNIACDSLSWNSILENSYRYNKVQNDASKCISASSWRSFFIRK